MLRANRHFLPGYVWHITHRCHRKNFLLKFARDRQSYLRWVFQANKRFGLSVLSYIVTSNHVHLLVQLIAGLTGQEYNQRKGRHGAFWEDRYHATAIEGWRPPAPLSSFYRFEHGSCPSGHAPL